MIYSKEIGRYLTNFRSKKVREMTLVPPYLMKTDRYFTKFGPRKSNIGQPYPIGNRLCPAYRGHGYLHIFENAASWNSEADLSIEL